MGSREIFTLETHFDLMNGGSVDQVVRRKMVPFFGSCWTFISTCFFFLIKFITRYFFRYQMGYISEIDDSKCISHKKGEEIVPPSNTSSRCFDSKAEIFEAKKTEYDESAEKRNPTSPSFSFKFHFRSSEDIIRSIEESEVPTGKEMLMTNLSRYCYQPEKDFAGFIQQAQITSCLNVEDSCFGSQRNSFSIAEAADNSFKDNLDKKFKEFDLEAELPHEELLKNECREVFEEFRKSDATKFSNDDVLTTETFVNLETNATERSELLPEKDCCGFDSEPDSITFSDSLSVKKQIIDSNSEGYLSERDFCVFADESMNKNSTRTEIQSATKNGELIGPRIQITEKTHLKDLCVSDAESIDFSDGFSYIDNQDEICRDTESMDFRNRSNAMSQSRNSVLSNEFLSESDFKQDFEGIDRDDRESIVESQESHDVNFSILGVSDLESSNMDQMDDSILSDKFLSENDFCQLGMKETGQSDESQKSDTVHLQNPSTSDSDDKMSALESIWEHQELIEQLQMELRKVKATGLPAILEESESPKTIEDLKPWRIDEMFLQEDPVDELQKFYKSYRVRMRKFDMLNRQKMCAVGFLQFEGPLQLMTHRKKSVPTSDADPSEKYIKELQSDLETVYVAQACLSWEFLHWQYERSGDLSESDPESSCQYNQVAGEFQQFQVLVQRFLENEPFQGPRIQNYAKSRCMNRNLLQVPVIKEDCLNERKEERRKVKDAITNEMLAEIMEKSMRIFWNFIKADKTETNAISKGFARTQIELQHPSELDLLIELQGDLQKKEKRLKDLLRSSHSLVRRFQKHQAEKSPDQLIFFAQVDMKLVARVLKMSNITSDQLVWCQKKLNKITFRDRKIVREPSFSLFPC